MVSGDESGGTSLSDERAGVLEDLGSDSDVLAVTFGGLLMRVAMMPPFEFFNILSRSAPAKKIFVRDHRQAWYHRGVRGLGNDVDAVAGSLRHRIDAIRPAKLVTIGTSAGGYAALLFGHLLGATEAHAFSPQTFISPELREHYGDRRWPRAWSELIASGCYEPRYGDLCEVLDGASPDRPGPASGGTDFVIHYGTGDELGAIHAERLAARVPGVRLQRYEIENKAVVRYLRATGELTGVLARILTE
jgi:hypothetical protein